MPDQPALPAADTSPGPILVVCTRYIGDTLLAIPFLRNLRHAFPSARSDVLTEGSAHAVLANCPYVDEFIDWTRPAKGRRGPHTTFAALFRQAAALRGRGYARAYLLKPSLSAALLATLARIPHRIGFAAEGRPLLTHAVRRPRGRHQVEAYLDLLRAEGFAIDDCRNENWVSPAAAARVAALVNALPLVRPRVLVVLRSSDARRHWPLDRWIKLVHWLVSVCGCEVVVCGGPSDTVACAGIVSHLDASTAAHVHDLSARVPLMEAGALMARMDLCIGVDSGFVHLAASLGVPAVVLVGPTDPNQWCPWKARSVVVRSARLRRGIVDRLRAAFRYEPEDRWPPGEASMEDLQVDDVRDAVDTFLRARPAPVTPALTGGVKTIDLRDGEYRYAVLVGAAGRVAPAGMAVAGG
jgi:heptosyltransferase-2